MSATTSTGNFSDCQSQTSGTIMAFFYPASIAAGAWVLASYTFDLKSKMNVPVALAAETNPSEKEPFQGPIGHISQYANVQTRGRFRSVQESVDELGATIFLVDYGSGGKTIQYIDPRILL